MLIRPAVALELPTYTTLSQEIIMLEMEKIGLEAEDSIDAAVRRGELNRQIDLLRSIDC